MHCLSNTKVTFSITALQDLNSNKTSEKGVLTFE